MSQILRNIILILGTVWLMYIILQYRDFKMEILLKSLQEKVNILKNCRSSENNFFFV